MDNNTIVALFLSEILRSRRTTIQRAAEISSRVLKLLSTVKNEAELLAMLGNLEKDFEEVAALKQALHFGLNYSELKIYEPYIRLYAAELVKTDMEGSAAFLKDASLKDASIQQLCLKYANFCQYLIANTQHSPV